MVEPTQIVITQATSHLQQFLEVTQLAATIFLAIVAVLQAKAANSQAETAREQAEAAKIQARTAKAQLDVSLSPKLLPLTWEVMPGGGCLTLLNQGQGTAYAVQWHFDREHNGADGEDSVPNGASTIIRLINPNLDRELIVTYHDKSGEEFTTRLTPTDQTLNYEYREPEGQELIKQLRAAQRGRRIGR
ncbi:hypothetical protein RBB77_13015 [Tunturibacter psychrotolerans]|uniref:Uncharacterized protein n=1 Tax=Tunturiibacter psychrotolerans TaxID=3069686 RepID=A0AAU7ZKH8_9BACT